MFKEVVKQVVLVPVDRTELFDSKIAKINKKLAKLGVQKLSLRLIDTVPLRVSKDTEEAVFDGKHWVRFTHRIEVEGWLPIFDGWKFVAKVDFVSGKSPMVFSTEPFPVHKIPTTSHCEHCNHKRQRNSVIIVEKDGVEKQIGSTCVKDFLGRDDLIQILNLWRSAVEISSDSLDGEFGGRLSNFHAFMSILVKAAAAVRQYGYVSRAKAMDMSKTATADMVFSRKLQTEAEDWELAQKVKEWYDAEWRNKTNPKSDFESNLIAAVHDNDTVHQRMVGFVVWLIEGYRKSLEPKVEKPLVVSDFLEPAPFYVMTVTSKKPTEGYYGPMTVVKMLDEHGNIAVWFASGKTDFLPIGEPVKVKLSIKKNDVFNGVKQTVVSHVKEMK